MSNIRRHGDRSQIIERFPDVEYADRLRLVRWRRSPTNPVYEAQVKLPGQEQWSAPFSLKTESRDTALFAAVREFGRRKQLQDAGLPMPARKKAAADRAENTFGDAARIVLARLKEKRATTLAAEGRQKANKHEQHIGRIGRMVREFEAVPVAEITGGRLHDWLASLQVGRPGACTRPAKAQSATSRRRLPW